MTPYRARLRVRCGTPDADTLGVWRGLQCIGMLAGLIMPDRYALNHSNSE